MRKACELARRGEGLVEPNPMVGCVVARERGEEWETLGEGWHERFGGPHAEVNALGKAGSSARGATAFVTLEPCCHTGKTPPCVEALLAAGVTRAVIACRDPFPKVDGGGIAALEASQIECVVGPGAVESRRILAPYLMLVEQSRPWVIAKWAMTLDGKIATRTGDSRWISGEPSRALVHELRGRVDAVMVGAGTLVADDPLLTARLPDGRVPKRVAQRIVVAGDRPLPLKRRLWDEGDSVIVATGSGYPSKEASELTGRGVELLRAGVSDLLKELGRRRMTNLLVEGGGKLIGRLLDEGLVDEVMIFAAPMLLGGADAPGPIAGAGAERVADSLRVVETHSELIGGDVLLRGRVER